MELHKIWDIIGETTIRSWNVIRTGPRFMYALDGIDQGGLLFRTHSYVLSYIGDVSLTVAGPILEDKEQEPAWSKVWIDNGVRVGYGDVFWNGALIDRKTVALVDSGRALLPLPDRHPDGDGWTITARQRALAYLLDEAAERFEFQDHLNRADFEII